MYRDSLRSMDKALELLQDPTTTNTSSRADDESTQEPSSPSTIAPSGSGDTSPVMPTNSEKTRRQLTTTPDRTASFVRRRLNENGSETPSTTIDGHLDTHKSSATEAATGAQKRSRARESVDDATRNQQTKRARLGVASPRHEVDQAAAATEPALEHVCTHRCVGTPPSTPPHYWDVTMGNGDFDATDW